MKNTTFTILGLAAMLLSIFTFTGHVQEFIHFSGVVNEMAFIVLCCLMSATFFLMIQTKPSHDRKS
jgi:hypothetical protein